MMTDQAREAFEKRKSGQGYTHGELNTDPSGNYPYPGMQGEWVDYQNAYAAGLSAGREQEWISVEDRLPPDGEPVMFGWWNTPRSSSVSHYCAELGMHRVEDGYWESERTAPQDEPIRFTDDSGQVTHWMPLPKPPVGATQPEVK